MKMRILIRREGAACVYTVNGEFSQGSRALVAVSDFLIVMPEPLQFQPLAGGLDVGFLAELGHRKLNEFGLRDDAVEIRGSFSCAGQHNVRCPPLSRAPRGPSRARTPQPRIADPACSAAPHTARLAAVR